MQGVFRRLIVLWLCLGLAVPAVAAMAQAAEGFVTGVEDMPLMPGLTQLGGAIGFDAPSGRIVEVYAEGAVTRERVLEFYAATLPQLGWQAIRPGAFRREGEMLQIEFPPPDRARAASRQAGSLIVRFFLSPG
ncbi:MAG: hypothetical protein HY057_12665 [Rhodospirillales bacterium]|nr:hypothetical protein [Rhodospirillales bacterium]